jgi:23S rRNA pseudouridine1911/1915/1917 synthase
MSVEHHVTVQETDAGTRLDKFLHAKLPALSRARIQQLMAEHMLHDATGKPITNASRKVKTGEIFCLSEPDAVPLDLVPEKMALDIIYEDDDLIVLNKPVGLTVHPAPGAYTGTLVHGLLAHCGDSLSGIGGVMRPGIVHRIDKDTSGLLVVAKHDQAHQHLSAQLKERSLSRNYLAWCWGGLHPPEQTVTAPLARHPRHRKKMAVVEGGKHAVTHFTTEQRYHANARIVASRVACKLETGRTHQIRVHMAHLGCGLIGDPTYGPSTATRLARLKSDHIILPEETQCVLHSLHGQALHAFRLSFLHPKNSRLVVFEAPLPAHLVALERALANLTS